MPGVTVKLSGPFFRENVPLVIGAALRAAVGDVVAEGERAVKLQLYPGHGLRKGRYRGSIHGETTSVGAGVALAAAGVTSGQFFASPHGIIHDSHVIYGPWLEGVSSRNETTRFKGYAMFRNAKQQLERKKRGILEHRIQQALRRLK